MHGIVAHVRTGYGSLTAANAGARDAMLAAPEAADLRRALASAQLATKGSWRWDGCRRLLVRGPACLYSAALEALSVCNCSKTMTVTYVLQLVRQAWRLLVCCRTCLPRDAQEVAIYRKAVLCCLAVALAVWASAGRCCGILYAFMSWPVSCASTFLLHSNSP